MKAIFAFFLLTATLAATVIIFTMRKDPYCNSCDTIDLHRHSVNSYYEVAQILESNRDAEVIIVGTSRGQKFSPQWLSKVLNKKVLNLSVAGSKVESKVAFIELAKKMLPLKLVIWQADYFEILGEEEDAKLHAMKIYNPDSDINFSYVKSKLLMALDHSNFDAAIAALGRKDFDASVLGQGAGSDMPESCFHSNFVGDRSQEKLNKEVDLMYYNYTKQVLVPPESQWKKDLMLNYLVNKIGVESVVVFMPTHPEFTKKFNAEYPRLAMAQNQWFLDLKNQGVNAFSYYEGISEDDGSPKFWSDGTHQTCYGSHLVLEDLVLKAGLRHNE